MAHRCKSTSAEGPNDGPSASPSSSTVASRGNGSPSEDEDQSQVSVPQPCTAAAVDDPSLTDSNFLGLDVNGPVSVGECGIALGPHSATALRPLMMWVVGMVGMGRVNHHQCLQLSNDGSELTSRPCSRLIKSTAGPTVQPPPTAHPL